MLIDPSLTRFPTVQRMLQWGLRVLTFGKVGLPKYVQHEPCLSSLPKGLAEVIVRVCSRTGLWASEQRDVAKELCTHFRDGLESGASAETLVKNFGDELTAAALIRRAKRRSRSAAWRVLHFLRIAVLGCVGLVVLLYAASAARYFACSPTIATNYIEVLNEPIDKLPKEQRAWTYYKQGLQALPAWPLDENHKPDLRTWPDVRPEDANYQTFVVFNRDSQAGLELIRRGAMLRDIGIERGSSTDRDLWYNGFRRIGTRPQGDEPPAEIHRSGEVIHVLLPHLGEMQGFSRAFVFDAKQAAMEKDGARALADVRAMLGMSRQLQREAFVISQLVGHAVVAFAAQTTRELLRDHPEMWSDEQLTVLAHEFAASPTPGRIVPDMTSERLLIDDTLQRVFTDDGQGDGRVTPEGLKYLVQVSGISRAIALSDRGLLA